MGPTLPIELVDRILELSMPDVRTLGIDNMALLDSRFPCPDCPSPSPLPSVALSNRRFYDLASSRLWRRVGLSLAPYAGDKLRFLARRPHLYAQTTSLFVSLAAGDDDDSSSEDGMDQDGDDEDNDNDNDNDEDCQDLVDTRSNSRTSFSSKSSTSSALRIPFTSPTPTPTPTTTTTTLNKQSQTSVAGGSSAGPALLPSSSTSTSASASASVSRDPVLTETSLPRNSPRIRYPSKSFQPFISSSNRSSTTTLTTTTTVTTPGSSSSLELQQNQQSQTISQHYLRNLDQDSDSDSDSGSDSAIRRTNSLTTSSTTPSATLSFNKICNRLVELIFQMPKLKVLALDLYDLAIPLPPPLLLTLLVRPLKALYLHEFLGHAFHSLDGPLPRSQLETTTTFPPFTPTNLTVLQLSCSTAAERLVPHFPNLKALMIRDNFPESPPNVFARWPWHNIEELVLLSATPDMIEAVFNGFQTFRRNNPHLILPLRQLVLGGRNLGDTHTGTGGQQLPLSALNKVFGRQHIELLGLHKFNNLRQPNDFIRLHRFSAHIKELAITCSMLTIQEPWLISCLIPFQKLQHLIIDSSAPSTIECASFHQHLIIKLVRVIPSLTKITLRFDGPCEAVQVCIPKHISQKLLFQSPSLMPLSDQAISSNLKWSETTEFDEWTHCLTHSWYNVPSWA